MKLISKQIDKYRSGNIIIIPENEEDMWVFYNLLQLGDIVTGSTMRKIQKVAQTGSVIVKQVRTNLSIAIETIEYDSSVCQIFVNGRNVRENEYVKIGAYHSLAIAINNRFVLSKRYWDIIALQLVSHSSDVSNSADLAAVIFQEGLAYVCLITHSATIVKCKIDMHIPNKRKGIASTHDKAIDSFIGKIAEAMDKNIRFDVVKCVIVASPGFLKEKLFDHLSKVAFETNNKTFTENKSKFLLVHSSTGHKHSLKEVLLDPTVQSKMANTKAASETKILEDFFKMLRIDSNRAFYGYNHIMHALKSKAIETLLISDSLFRCRDFKERRKYVDIVDSVKKNQGIVKIFSSCHISGEQLDNLSGIAAILRFPISDPCSSDEDSSDETETR